MLFFLFYRNLYDKLTFGGMNTKNINKFHVFKIADEKY